MADNLTIEQGRVLFAQLSTLPAPWWQGMQRAGQILQAATWEPGATVDEIREAAGLMWDAIACKPAYQMPDGRIIQSTNSTAIVRSDTGQELGMMGAGYQIHTMKEIFDTFAKLCETSYGGGWKLVTCGALKGSCVIWAQAERDESAEVVPGDTIAHRIMLQTSFDGSQPTGAADGETRIVCDNTRRANWAEARNKATQRHRSKLNGSNLIAKAGINTGSESFVRSMEALRRLADVSCSDGQARDLLAKILQGDESKKIKPQQQPTQRQGDSLADLLQGSATLASSNAPAAPVIIGIGNSVQREHRNTAPILSLFDGAGQGSGLDGVKGTRYGLLNAVTEFVDHHQGRTYDTGRTAAMFGQGATLKDRAFEILCEGTAAAEMFA